MKSITPTTPICTSQSSPSFEDILSSWPSIRSDLLTQLGKATFNIWISPLCPLALSDLTLIISSPPTSCSWVEQRFGSLILSSLKSHLQVELDLLFIHTRDSGPDGLSSSSPQSRSPSHGFRGPDIRPQPNHGLSPRYTFDQFVIGNCNHFAHAACLAVAELPSQAYNPLYLHAENGLGKTHLLQAIANYTQEYSPSQKCIYTSAESFTNHFISCLRSGDLSSFKDHYRHCDILIVDDIQFLEGKNQTEEEFFHTFNAIYNHGGQIVLSSDRPPSHLSRLHNRLKSRFELGLTVSTDPPDFDTRLAILTKKSKLDSIPLPDATVLNHIAHRIHSNIRALEGALIRSVAYSSLTGNSLSTDLVNRVLHNLYRDHSTSSCSIDSIKEVICSSFSISSDDLLSQSRSSSVTYPRHLAMYLSRELTDLSLPEIARSFNRLNHTTVISAHRKIAHLASTDPSTSQRIKNLSDRLLSRNRSS